VLHDLTRYDHDGAENKQYNNTNGMLLPVSIRSAISDDIFVDDDDTPVDGSVCFPAAVAANNVFHNKQKEEDGGDEDNININNSIITPSILLSWW
jgi:hypothetical protein